MGGKLDNRVAMVTGGGSGLGRAIATLFAEEGAAVGVLDRDECAANVTAEKIRASRGRAIAIPTDVSSAKAMDVAVDRLVSEFNRLDILCNSAGVLVTGTVTDTDDEDWDRCFAVNSKGTFLSCRAAMSHLIADGGGAVINIASAAALSGQRGFAAYSASKGAVVALTRSMAVDFGAHGVRVNVICPGAVPTAMTDRMFKSRGDGDAAAGIAQTVSRYPLGRLGTPEEIARVAVFLASDDASFVTGAIVSADGGLTAQ